MHKIGHQDLVEWVNAELNGYPKDKPVPSYRIIGSRLEGNLQNMAYIQRSLALPTGHLPEKLRNYFHKTEMRESISVLEQFSVGEGMHLKMPVPPELHAEIEKALDGAWVQSMWIRMEPTQIAHGLTVVRSRLLDFILGLQDKLGNVEDSDVKEAAKNIDAPALFQHTVFGDNTTIVVGNKNTTTINNVVKKGDFDSLAALLKEKGIPGDDIAALKAAIDEDKETVDYGKKQFGPQVKAWIKNMWGKAVDFSWQVDIGGAGGLLANALQAYYFS